MTKGKFWLVSVAICGLFACGTEAPRAEEDSGCTPGAARCWEQVAQLCDDAGQWQNEVVCPFLCEAGACVGVCAHDERRCEGSQPERCEAGAWEVDGVPCEFGCGEGVCQPACEDDALRCDGLQAQRCEEGAWTADRDPCPFGCAHGACTGLCEEGAGRCWGEVAQVCEGGVWQNDEHCPFMCEEGTCAGVCVPGDVRCDGLGAEVCEAGAWQPVETCEYGCEAGACVGTCEEGARRCAGDALLECDAVGQWELHQTCAFLCIDEGCAGVCEPGTSRCDGDVVSFCGPDGTWSAAQACPSGCDGGACLTQCTADETRCLGDVLQRCDELGLWANDGVCTLGCEAGACVMECNPDETQCAGEVLQRCSAEGLWEDEASCSFGCAAGACLECAHGQARCDGSLQQVCEASGTWSAPMPCDSGERCDGGFCVEVVTPSCEGGGPGRSDCGPSGDQDCCESLFVPGGSFFQDNDPALPATVTGFTLDRYEVTVGRFRQFVDAMNAGWQPQAGDGRHTHAHGGAGLQERGMTIHETGWDPSWQLPADWDAAFASAYSCNWTSQPGSNENLAMNCIHWQEAYAFCIWDGGFLPSEAEWNYAAAGGGDQRLYPWGSADPSTGDYAYHAGACSGFCMAPDEVGVHPDGAGRWGHEDMAGNTAEWVLDWYRPYTGATCVDCVSLDGSAAFHGMRGGAHWDMPGLITTDYRYYGTPDFRVIGAGARCARAP